MANQPLRAAIYARISSDREGEEVGVTRQREDCLALAEREQHDVRKVYTDNDRGASTRSKKARPEFAAMLDAARSGEYDVIVSYSNSRLTRRPRELEDLLDLHERHGVRIVTVVSGEDDLSTADGRMVARIKSNIDAAEAERTGERVSRAHRHNAGLGKPFGGPRPFGWKADRLALDPGEADLIRAAADDVIDGLPVRRIAQRWQDAGVPTARGGPWRGQTVRAILANPRLAGWGVYRGEVARDSHGERVRGEWEPIMEPIEWERLQGALEARGVGKAKHARPGRRRHLLAGVLRCGTCGGAMYGNARKGELSTYGCQGSTGNKHTMTISGPLANETVTAVVLARLESETLETRLPAAAFPDADRLADVTSRIADLMKAFTEERLSANVVFPAVEKLEAEQAELRVAETEFFARAAGPRIRNVTPDEWADLDTDRRRAIVSTVLDAAVVRPRQPGTRKRFDPDRITYVWRQS